MVKIGSIERWTKTSPLFEKKNLIYRLTKSEAEAINNNKEARDNLYKLFDELTSIKWKKEPIRARKITMMIQNVIYLAVWQYKLEEQRKILKDMLRIKDMINRDVEDYPERNVELALEYVNIESIEKDVRQNIKELEADEGFRKIYY